MDPAEAAAFLSALRTRRDRAIVEAMLLGGLRRNEALGLRLEAIAALLGHRSPRTTVVYARICNDSLAEQYFSSTKVAEAVSGLPEIDYDAQVHAHEHQRLLGNGRCSDRASSTAPIRRSARAAGSSRQDPSSSQSCVAKGRARASSPTSSASASTKS